MKRIACLGLCLLLCAATLAYCAEPISGTVKIGNTKKSTALPDANIVFVQWSFDGEFHPMPPLTTRTDNEGRFQITLEPGLYDVIASCAAICQPQARQIRIKGGELDFNFTLRYK